MKKLGILVAMAALIVLAVVGSDRYAEEIELDAEIAAQLVAEEQEVLRMSRQNAADFDCCYSDEELAEGDELAIDDLRTMAESNARMVEEMKREVEEMIEANMRAIKEIERKLQYAPATIDGSVDVQIDGMMNLEDLQVEVKDLQGHIEDIATMGAPPSMGTPVIELVEEAQRAADEAERLVKENWIEVSVTNIPRMDVEPRLVEIVPIDGMTNLEEAKELVEETVRLMRESCNHGTMALYADVDHPCYDPTFSIPRIYHSPLHDRAHTFPPPFSEGHVDKCREGYASMLSSEIITQSQYDRVCAPFPK